MDQLWVRPTRRRLAKAFIHIDIWEAIFDQLAILGFHRTLASCARLNRELSWLAIRYLYKEQFSPSTSWGTQLADVLWTTLWTSAPGTEGPSTTQPYVNYVRHLDFLNFLSIRNCRDFPHPHFISETLQQANHQNPSSTNTQDIVVANQITARTPNVGTTALRLLRDLCRTTRRRNLRVMLKSLTIDKWAHVLPVIRSFHELESLSLVFMEGLDSSAADMITRYLPSLRSIVLVQASVPHTPDLASFLSQLKPDQLRTFGCSLHRIQAPVLRAISRQKHLQKLSLQFLIYLPVEMHRLFELQNLTELNLSFNFLATRPAQTEFQEWVASHRSTFANWLMSCQNLRSLHLFRFPDLIPAIADALPHLHLERLHIFSTGLYRDFYVVLKTQRLKYLFLAESPDMLLVNPPLGWRERGGLVMDAVMAMPGLRDLRLHTYFPLGYRELKHISRHVPKLQAISFVSRQEENPAWTLRALEPFKHLTSLTVLGRTVFSSRGVLQWIDHTQCYLRPGGFSLSLPAQDSRSWFGGLRVSRHITDPATESIKNMLRFFIVYSREQNYHGEIWRGNDYEFDEERMFVHIWDDIRGPAEALQLLRGSGPYPPFLGLMENMGERIASSN